VLDVLFANHVNVIESNFRIVLYLYCAAEVFLTNGFLQSPVPLYIMVLLALTELKGRTAVTG